MFQNLSAKSGRFFYFVHMPFPIFLKPGDQVAIVATAKRLESSVDRGVQLLEKWGLKVLKGDYLYEKTGYFAGTDAERLLDLQGVLDNPEVKAIVFARGGYGTTRILDGIDFKAFEKSPKWLIGFSDLTSMLLQASSLNLPSIHGPVCVTIGQDDQTDDYLKDLLFGQLKFSFPLPVSTLTKVGQCSGKIVGGNLSLICESIGASNEIQTKGNILFLEEVGEGKYSVDRMMNKLKRCGKLAELSGVIIGDFTKISDPNKYFSESVEEILMEYFKSLSIPIAFGLKAGHEKANYPLAIGLKANVTINSDTLNIQYLYQETSE